MTYRSLVNRIRGYVEGLEMMERSAWERTRWQTAYLLSVHTKQGQRIKPQDLVTFPWEQPEKPKALSAEELELMRQRWAKWDKQMK